MKIIVGLAAATLATGLAGCAIGNRPLAPTALAPGAAIGMWTARPTDDVRACVEQVVLQTSSPYRYEVTGNDLAKTPMTTTVSGFTNGNSDPAAGRIAATCL